MSKTLSNIATVFFDLCEVTNTKLKFIEAVLFKFTSCLNRRVSMKTIYLWPKMNQLIALSEKNKQNRVLYTHLLVVAKFACYSSQKLLAAKSHLLVVAKLTRNSLQKLLLAKIHSLLVAKFACYSLQQIARYSFQKLIY